MKKLCLTMIAVFFLVCSIGVQAQTTQAQLNQMELMKQFLGTWQANAGKDTIEVWEFKQLGNAYLINTSQVVKGQKTPLYVNNMGFDSKAGKFKGYTLWLNGGYGTWIGSFTAKEKFLGDFVTDFNPETVYLKFQSVSVSPNEWIFTQITKDGVKTLEYKFNKVK
jgi:hypothetical protein